MATNENNNIKYVSLERLAQFKDLLDKAHEAKIKAVDDKVASIEALQLKDENGNVISVANAVAAGVNIAKAYTDTLAGTPDEGKTLQDEIDALEALLAETGATGAAIKANAEAIEQLNNDLGKASVAAAEGKEAVAATGLHADVEKNATDIAALQAAIGSSDAEGSLVDRVATLETALAEGGETAKAIADNAADIAELQGLHATKEDGSFETVREAAADEADKVFKKVMEGEGVDPDVVETFKELNDYIEAHGEEAAGMLASINALETVVGTDAKEAVGEEGQDGYEAATEATGLFKTVNEKIAAAVESVQAGEVESAKEAAHATDSDNATKATQDAEGNVISETYATKAAVEALDADITSSNENAIVTIQVVQEDGKITGVNVTNVLTECSSEDIAALFE